MSKLTVGSLFSGIGGFDIGLERAGFEIEWQVEIDDYCRRVLGKHWPAVPCHYDITTIDWRWIPRVDLVCGGFPCQPFSCAGKRRGKEDDRYLWPEVVRCLAVLRPTWFLGENVPGLLHLGIEQVLTDLAALGYQTAVLGIPACGVDAPHVRQRLWIVAYAGCSRDESERASGVGVKSPSSLSGEARQQRLRTETHERGEDVAYAEGQRESSITGSPCERILQSAGGCGDVADAPQQLFNGAWHARPRGLGKFTDCREWLPEPNVGRVAHGVPAQVDRLRGLGNAIVPQIAEALGRMILESMTPEPRSTP